MKARIATVLVLLALAACRSDGDDAGSGAPASQLPPPPPPPPPVGAANYNVDPCLVQFAQPGSTVAILVVPDTLSIDFSRPAGFPNGRKLEDPVVDRTLAMIFLDLSRHSIDALHDLPLNPPGNDKPLRATFPYLAPPSGPQPVPQGGSNFNFRTDPIGSYTRVDRMGMPAVATALISSSHKNEYNDDSPREDASFKWVPEIRSTLTGLTNALADDFTRLNLTICARQKG